MNLARNIKSSKKKKKRVKGRLGKMCVQRLNGAGKVVTGKTEKAEVLHTFYALVFW